MRWLCGFLLLTCAPAPEIRREVPRPREANPDASLPAGSAMDPSLPVTTPSFGSVLVVMRTADGQEYTMLCGGDVSLSGPEERKLLRLDRQPGGVDQDSGMAPAPASGAAGRR